MGRSNTHSSSFRGQATPRDEPASGRGTFGAVKRPTQDEEEARWHFLKVSSGHSAGWGEVFLSVARALGAQPAA
jgi:hypothetical protein